MLTSNHKKLWQLYVSLSDFFRKTKATMKRRIGIGPEEITLVISNTKHELRR